MPIGLRNLDGYLKSRIDGEIGETYYLVDSNFRTAAQGWTREDGTGPLDLYSQRNPGYVFYTPGTGSPSSRFTTDAAAMQAAIDAMVDFRGDTLYFTPGTYTPATALRIDVPDARWLGPTVSDPILARANIVGGVASALAMTAAADRCEYGYLRFVPLTAASLFTAAAGTDNVHFHDFFYDVRGITPSTSTIFLTGSGTTNDYFKFNNFVAWTDGAQGPLLSMVGTYRALLIENFIWYHTAGTLATCLLLDNSAGDAGGPGPVEIRNGRGVISGGGAVTNLVALTDAGIDTQWIAINGFRGAIGFCAADALISLTGGTGNTAEAAETGIVNSFLDVVGGGAGGIGTAYTQ
jgi:hypothetical protein